MAESSIENLLDPSKLQIESPAWDRLEDSHELTMVHMNEREVEPLIALNGEPDMREEEGLGKIYAFPKLADLFENKEVRRLFIDSVTHRRNRDPSKSDFLSDLHDEGLARLPSINTNVPGESEGQREVAHEGENGDDMLVELPMNVVKTFIEIEGKNPNINPHTGLLAFGKGWKNDLIRGLTTMVGAIYGGGTGAAAMHLAGRMATGQSLSHALMPSAKIGAITYGAQKLLPNIPGVASGISKLAQYYPQLGAALGSAAGTNATQQAPGGMGAFTDMSNKVNNAVSGVFNKAVPLINGSQGFSNSQNAATNQGAGKTAGVNGQPGTTSIGQNGPEYQGLLGSPMADLALVGGLNWAGSQRHQKFLEKQKRDSEERYEKERQRAGLDKPLQIPDYDRRIKNPAWDVGNGEPYFIYEHKAPRYAEGGYVEEGKLVKKKINFEINGPGKGQDDLILTRLEPSAYIVPSDATSMFGDGATDAGQETLKDFVSHYASIIGPTKNGKKIKPVKEEHSVVARVANGETEIPRRFVTNVLGEGSNKVGVKLLDKMVKNIRLHKASKGDKLPPKALHPLEYMQGR